MEKYKSKNLRVFFDYKIGFGPKSPKTVKNGPILGPSKSLIFTKNRD